MIYLKYFFTWKKILIFSLSENIFTVSITAWIFLEQRPS